ncbi:MAG TPA: hypothetical protein VGJ90_07685 [Methylophilaceae bacterium]|jgi:hypothetical protein
MNAAVLIIFVVMLVTLYRQYRHANRYNAEARAQLFDACSSLLQKVQKSQDQAGLPVLQGDYADYKVGLSVVVDTLGWRKVPPMWLLIKVEANTPSIGTLDYIVRPTNNEFYSPSWQWDGVLTIPSAWPQHAILKYQQQPVDLTLLEAHVPTLFADANMKELLLTPQMVRLTYLVKQAERGEYLIMRNAIYENTPIASDVVARLLKQAIAIRQNVEYSDISQIKLKKLG